MKFMAAKFGRLRSWHAIWPAGLSLLLALCVVGLQRSPVSSLIPHREDERAAFPSATGSRSSESNNRFEVRNYFLDFAGDHSLDVATVIEQPSSGYTRYTVQLHLASGAEQSVVVSAPPGGLQIEMHDMTGDKIPNDVVLRPALVRWLPTVLVNDGHEHFEIATSATDPKSFSSNEDLGSRRRDSQTFALLTSSGFKVAHLPNTRRRLDPQSQQWRISCFAETATNRLDHAPSPGRAPPIATTI